MYDDVLRLIFIFAIAFLMSFASTPIASILAHKVGAIDVPKDNRRMHKQPIPRMGGVAIFYAYMIAVLCLCDINLKLRGILIGATLIEIVGILDDIYDLKPLIKLVAQIAAALIVAVHGVTISFFTNPIAGGMVNLDYLSIPVTVIWIVAITNALNLIDGLDGLAVGISSITAVSLFTISIMMGDYTIALLSAALLGSCTGFLPYNFHPAKIFMGDSGSTFLGFLLACISIMGLFKVYAIMSFAVPFIVLGLPLFDTVFAIIRRIAKGQSPMQADRGHLHHRLIDAGFSQKRAVLVLYTISSLLSLSAVVMMFTHSLWRTLLLVVSVLVLLVFSGGLLHKKVNKIS
ncbi:MAG: MraY family glycosyltransferase [Eubacteriales bacterium]|nr:MraY family glycosyltransferase [Eubacteriales bacterium]